MSIKKVKTEQMSLQTNIIQQNVYIRDVSVPVPSQKKNYDRKFITMEENTHDGVLSHDQRLEDYKITPSYVNSFAEAADYRNDPIGAIVRGEADTRKNLGDVTDFQKVAAMDDQQAAETLANIKQRFEKAYADYQAAQEKEAQQQQNPQGGSQE